MNDLNTVSRGIGASTQAVDAGLRSYMQSVYAQMGIGLMVSAAVAYGVGMSSLGIMIQGSFLRYIVMFLPLIMVFGFGAAVNKLSIQGARLYFYAFAAAMGLSLSWIFMVFNLGSITTTFLATSVAFLSLSLWGYTTKRDISGWGSFLMIGLVGIIVASLINIFLRSEAIQFAVSIIGVLIFAGLTAYDTQKIKNTYLQMRGRVADNAIARMAIYGALELYLDFINMFMFLLNFFGSQE